MALTPMMQQYLDMKAQNPDCILMFRLGDFYEMFFEDALTVSKELELTLTGRDCGLAERAPMCGVPYHAVDGYIARLIEKGHRVAICEQLTDPSESKGMLERGIVRIITAGTVVDMSMLEEKANLYLVSLCRDGEGVGYAVADVSTGTFFCGQLVGANLPAELMDLLVRLKPGEIIADSQAADWAREVLSHNAWDGPSADAVHDWWYEPQNAERALKAHFQVDTLESFGVMEFPLAMRAAGALMQYLLETQKNALQHMVDLKVEHQQAFMMLDAAARRNLELTTPLRGKNKKGTLLNLLDNTKTAMGGRMLRGWMESPLQDRAQIESRLDAVEVFYRDHKTAQALQEALSSIQDLERLAGKVAYGSFNARDALAVGKSLQAIPAAKALCAGSPLLEALQAQIDDMPEWAEELVHAIADQPPIPIKEGGLFRDGYHAELDELRGLSSGGKDWLQKLEAAERESTGIKNLKVGYNRVFGYYIEVT
nr:DNA mismatch repair protein MutS [bacterium]